MRALGSWIHQLHQRLSEWLRAFYGIGPGAHEVSGAVCELFGADGQGPALHIERWEGGSACVVRDRVGRRRVTLAETNGTLKATACTCLPHRELGFPCRHMRAADAALRSARPEGPPGGLV